MFSKILDIFKSKSIKVNYLLNLTRVLSGALIAIITMPYINKSLGPEVLGKVEYVNVLINYFVLFSALGIPMYGIREISKVRDQPVLLARTTLELLGILLATTVVSYIVLFGIVYNLDYFSSYRDLILLMSIMIFLTNIGAEWFFQGLEEQLYITVRYVAVRLVSVFLILFYISSPNDYLLYALCLVITACGANLLNIYYLYRKSVRVEFDLKKLNFKRHLKPVLTIFLATVSVNIYLQLDYFLLGSLVGDTYVGYYAVANKLIRFVIGFITVIGSVMLPRLSLLYDTDRVLYQRYLEKSFSFLILLSIPCSLYFFAFAEPLIMNFGGGEYTPSILTMKILSPLCIIVSLAYFMGFLILYPMGKEKIYTWAVVFSALFSLVVNFFAIKEYKQDGAAVIAVLSELFAIIYMYVIIRKFELVPHFLSRNMLLYFVAGAVMLVVAILLQSEGSMTMVKLGIFSGLSFGMYFLVLLLLKEKFVQEIFLKVKHYIIK